MAADADERAQAGFTLLEAQLEFGAGRAALALARQGEKADALDVWSRRSNLDRVDLRGLAELAQAGLRSELRAFYEELARTDLDCAAPALLERGRGRAARATDVSSLRRGRRG